jgi:hypothetical protein
MEHLTFPFGAGGLTLEVLIGLDGHATAKLHAAGQPRPADRPFFDNLVSLKRTRLGLADVG